MATVTSRSRSTRTKLVPRLADAVQVQLPHLEIPLARIDHRVFHLQPLRKTLDRAPARIGMFDVRLFVQLEEFELVVGKLEQLPPAMPLQAEPAVFFHDASAVAGNVGPLGAGIGYDTFEPVPVRHQAFPGGPGELGARDGLRSLNLLARKTDARAQILENLPVRAAAAVLVVGDDLLAARADDADARVPVGAVGRHLELEHRVAVARVEAVLHREHACAALREVLPEVARAAAEVVDRRVQPREDALPHLQKFAILRASPVTCRMCIPVLARSTM